MADAAVIELCLNGHGLLITCGYFSSIINKTPSLNSSCDKPETTYLTLRFKSVFILTKGTLNGD